jgi:hypothetical protein
MRASSFLGAAAVALTALSGAASAQSIGIYVGPAYDDSYYDYYEGPRNRRVYGYGPPVYTDRIEVYPDRYRRGGCGTYHYWDGDRCVDARGTRGYRY